MKIAVVGGLCAEHDAISGAIADQVAMLTTLPLVDDIAVFGQHIQRRLPCPTHELHSAGRLVAHPDYASADLAIFHWGIRYDLFDALAISPVDGPAIAVHFHNLTPEHLVPEPSRHLAHQSLLQAQLMTAERIRVWTYSEFNRATLRSWGIAEPRIDMVPFRIEPPRPLTDRRPVGTFDLASIGRFVPAKGQLTLIEAFGLLPEPLRTTTRIRFAGNALFSDAEYTREMRRRILELDASDQIQFIGQPSDADLWRLYETTHVVVSTSHHEGLCVPVIEGYIAGCHAIGTTEGNLPFVVQPPDPVVPPNDPAALAGALVDVAGYQGTSRRDSSSVSALIAFHGSDSVRDSLVPAIRRAIDRRRSQVVHTPASNHPSRLVTRPARPLPDPEQTQARGGTRLPSQST